MLLGLQHRVLVIRGRPSGIIDVPVVLLPPLVRPVVGLEPAAGGAAGVGALRAVGGGAAGARASALASGRRIGTHAVFPFRPVRVDETLSRPEPIA